MSSKRVRPNPSGRLALAVGICAALVLGHGAVTGSAQASTQPTVKDQSAISRVLVKHFGSGAKANRSCWSFGAVQKAKGGQKRVRVTSRAGAATKSGCSAAQRLAELPGGALVVVSASGKAGWKVLDSGEPRTPSFSGPEVSQDLNLRFLVGPSPIQLPTPRVEPLFYPLQSLAANNQYVLSYERQANQAIKTGSILTSGPRSTAAVALAVPPSCSRVDFSIKQDLDNITSDNSAATRIEVRELNGPILATGEMVWNRPPETYWRSSTESSISVPVKADGSQVLALFLDPTHERFTTWSNFTVNATGLCKAVPQYGDNRFEIISATLDESVAKIVARMTSAYSDGQRRDAAENTQVSFDRELVRVGPGGLIEIISRSRGGNFEYQGNTSQTIRCDAKECTWR
jgi:hypothetical protein